MEIEMKAKKKKVTKKKSKKKWIPKLKKGALKKQLGYKPDEKIPTSVLDKIIKAKVGSSVVVKGKSKKVTAQMKKRAVIARKLRTFKKRSRKKK